jgi:hypothetical protein
VRVVRNKARYTAIGYVVSKFVIPVLRRRAATSARRRARGTVHGAAGAARAHPARTSIALGAAAGALGWLLMRERRSQGGSPLDGGDA